MNKQKIMKWALPALLMSAMTFELMAGSVRVFTKDLVNVPESTGYNFFTVEAENLAASCLPIAGVVTFAAFVLALVSACIQKRRFYRATSWCSLAAGALTAVPYVSSTEDVFVQPNVIVLLILVGCWLLAGVLDKKKNVVEENAPQGPHL